MNAQRTPEYQKDQEKENLLEKLNRFLEPLEREEVSAFSEPKKPTLFVVGAPRSATTLTHQLCAQTEQFGYISNYIARFWMAPYIGALQQKALGILKSDDISYKSDFGRTHGWAGPHQFNYFWQRWLQYDENHQMKDEIIESIDIEYFRQEIAALESVLGKPILFKSLYCGLQIPFLKRALKNSKFVVCVREPLYQAQSILIGRKAFFGSEMGWFSLKPPQYHELKHEEPYIQVAGQIYYILTEIGKGLADMDQSEYLVLNQADLVDSPRREITRILKLAGLHLETPLDEIPERFENRNEQHLGDDDWAELKNAVFQYFEGRSSIEVLLGAS